MGNVASERASESSTPHPVYENISAGQERNISPPPGAREVTGYPQAAPPSTYENQKVGQQYQPDYQNQPETGRYPPPVSQSYVNVSSQHMKHQAENQPVMSDGSRAKKSSSHVSQPPHYGYVRTSRSAPVTPIPQQYSDIPDDQVGNQSRSRMPPDKGQHDNVDSGRLNSYSQNQSKSNKQQGRTQPNMGDRYMHDERPSQDKYNMSADRYNIQPRSDIQQSKSNIPYSQAVYQNHPIPAQSQSYVNMPGKESSEKQPNYYNLASNAPQPKDYRYTPSSSISESVSSSSQTKGDHYYSNSSTSSSGYVSRPSHASQSSYPPQSYPGGQLPQSYPGGQSSHSYSGGQPSGRPLPQSYPDGQPPQPIPGGQPPYSTHSQYIQSQLPSQKPQRTTSQSHYPAAQPNSSSQSQYPANPQQLGQRTSSLRGQNPYQYSQRDPSPNSSFKHNNPAPTQLRYSNTPSKTRDNPQPQSAPLGHSHSASEGFAYRGHSGDYPDKRASYLDAQDVRGVQQYTNPHDVRGRSSVDQ